MFKKIINEYKNSYKSFVPFELMIEDGIILNKNNGFQTTFKIRFHDLDYIPESEYIQYIKNINNAYKRLPDGYAIHFEIARKKTNKYPHKEIKDSPIPTQIIEKLREESIVNDVFYKTDMYLTITYIISEELNANIDKVSNNLSSLFAKKSTVEVKVDEIKARFQYEYNEFKNNIILFVEQYKTAVAEMELLKNEELLGYLYSAINFENVDKLKVPKHNEIALDEYLTTSVLEKTDEYTKINGEYIKSLTINVFPDEIYPRILTDLETLNFEYRNVIRYIVLTREEALDILKKYRIYYSMKVKTGLQWLVEAISKKEVQNVDSVSVDKMNEAQLAEDELKTGVVSYGYYTFNIFVKDKSLSELEKKVQEIKKIVQFHDFTMLDDKYNTFDSIFGAIPGNVSSNVRRLPMNTMLLSSLLPLSSVYTGNLYNKHLKDTCLFTTKTESDLFYFNLHVGDIGHTLVLGPTGAGKSTLLGFIAAEFMKYKHKKKGLNKVTTKQSRVIFFDKGGSSKVLSKCCGGDYFDLGNNDLSFQPLKNIDNDVDKRQALDWICKILEQEKISITATHRTIIWEALNSLAHSNKASRTLSNFKSYVQNTEIRNALNFYCGNGAYAKYFDSNNEDIVSTNFLVFEMGEVVREPKVINPLLDYLFYKIEREILDGTPTLIILDECWLFLKNEQMKDKIEEWLKVLRKKNTSVIFATQSLSDVVNSSIYSTIVDACKTSVFLPNEKANSNWKELYQKFNLNSIEIDTINDAVMKREYFLKNTYGSRLFSLNLSKIELAYIASSSNNDQQMIDYITDEVESMDLTEKSKNILINNKWLEYKYNELKIPLREVEIYKDILKGE